MIGGVPDDAGVLPGDDPRPRVVQEAHASDGSLVVQAVGNVSVTLVPRDDSAHALRRAVRKAIDEVVAGCGPVESTLDLPDDAVPAVVQAWLARCEEVCRPLLEVVATGVGAGADEVWAAALERLVDEVAEDYPALLLACAIGVAAVAAGRDELVHVVLRGDVVERLRTYRVIDPLHVRGSLSARLRSVLRPAFAELGAARFARAFEDFEYLKSLLELHESAAAASLGDFAADVARGRSQVVERVGRRLGAGSPLLRAGAFGGDPANVELARRRLDAVLRTRYG